MSLIDKRIPYKPFEYPEILIYTEAIQKGYWVHTEVDFTADIQDYNTALDEVKKEIHKRSIISIAQVEVTVKGFWGDLYHYFPKPEINGLGATFAECYIEGTEVLTKTGWKDFRDLTKEEEVATFDDKRKIFFTQPSNYISKPYIGKMYKLSSKDQLSYITPRHKLTLYGKDGLQYHQEAEKVSFNNSDIRIPVSCGINVQSELEYNKYLTDWDRLRIAIQADGHKRFFRLKDNSKQDRGINSDKVIYELTFSKKSKIERLHRILDNLSDIQYYRRDYNSGKTSFEVLLNRKENDLKSFNWILKDERLYDSNWTSGIISELSYWDGQYLKDKKDCKIKYSTNNELNADIIQIVGTLAGYKTNIQVREDLRKETFSDIFIISFNKNRETLPITSLTKEEVDYNGNVYCVTIPLTGNLITRYNKKIFWSGNCEFRHSEAYSRILDVNGYTTAFEEELQNPVFRDYNNMVVNIMKDGNKTIFEKLLFFVLVIENTSLFSKFANILSFTHFDGVMKNTANMIAWTSVDEDVHANAGIYLINKMREEGLISESINQRWIEDACRAFIHQEDKMLDWIFEKGELPYYSKNQLLSYMKVRLNEALGKIGFEPVFNTTEKDREPFKWFEEEIYANSMDDFFAKRPVDYTKHDKPVTADDLF